MTKPKAITAWVMTDDWEGSAMLWGTTLAKTKERSWEKFCGQTKKNQKELEQQGYRVIKVLITPVDE
jgi:hypothetical protein